MADKIVNNYYAKLADATVTKKEEIEKEFRRFRQVLTDNNLKVKTENKVSKFLRNNGDSIAYAGIASALSAVPFVIKNAKKL